MDANDRVKPEKEKKKFNVNDRVKKL